MSQDLRIAFWGNIANAHFPTVQVLRASGIDAHLFVGDTDPAGWRPETDDPSLKAGYPDWIHEGPWLRPQHSIAPWTSPVIELLNTFDVVVASGSGVAVAQFAEPPMIFYSSGGDLTVRPFPWAFRRLRGSVPHQIGHGALSMWQRRSIRRSAQIWTQPFRPFVDALERLGIEQERVADIYFPLIVNTDMFRPDPGETPRWAKDLAPDADFVILHPSRLVLDDSPLMMRSGQTKGSGHVLDGFAKFLRTGVAERPVLLLPDNPYSNEADKARDLIAELGIEDSVIWAKPPEADKGFRRTEMVHLYNRADVTINEFGAGWFGWVSLEALSCGKPVISRIDEPIIDKLYGPGHPWLHAQDGSEMALRLVELITNPAKAQEIGAQSRAWIEKHHAFDTAGQRAVESVRTAMGQLTGESLLTSGSTPADGFPKAA